MRIASPYRLRASRFEHAFVASLQDGEFPRRDRGEDPFLSEAQRLALGLEPRRDPDAEERYLFHACLALPSRRLFLSYRDSDENGVAEPRSPFLDEVRGLLDPAPEDGEADAVEAELTVVRDLTRVLLPRHLAAIGGRARAGARRRRPRAARPARSPTRPCSPPSPPSPPTAARRWRGSTSAPTAGSSRTSSTRSRSTPTPDPLVQGGLMHAVLERLYRERPGGDPLPRPGSLGAWIGRARELVGEVGGRARPRRPPAERAIARRVEGLLARFLADEAARETGGFEPWLLEATLRRGRGRPSARCSRSTAGACTGRSTGSTAHRGGRALVIDYKLSRAVTPREKFEEQAKLQLQLYLIAVAEHWGADAVGGLYHPLRGTSSRRPRGAVLEDAAAQLASYRLYDNDLVDREGFERDARRRPPRAGEIVARMRAGEIRRDPGPRRGLRGHDVCPAFCDFAPICRRDRAPAEPDEDGNDGNAPARQVRGGAV